MDPVQYGLLAIVAVAFGVVLTAGGFVLVMFH